MTGYPSTGGLTVDDCLLAMVADYDEEASFFLENCIAHERGNARVPAYIIVSTSHHRKASDNNVHGLLRHCAFSRKIGAILRRKCLLRLRGLEGRGVQKFPAITAISGNSAERCAIAASNYANSRLDSIFNLVICPTCRT